VRRKPDTELIVLTAHADVETAVQAMRLGAYDYVAKPLDIDEISLVMARAVESRRARDPRRPAPPPRAEACSEDDMELQVARVGFHRAVEEARERASAEYLAALMRLFHGNVMQAAARAGMTRESLYRVLKQHGINPDRYRKPAHVQGHAHEEEGRACGHDEARDGDDWPRS